MNVTLPYGSLNQQMLNAATAAGINSSNISSLTTTSSNAVAFSAIGSSAESAGASYTLDNLHPSIAPNLTYREYYEDAQILANTGIQFSQVNWANMPSSASSGSTFSENGSVYSYNVSNVPLVAGGTVGVSGSSTATGIPIQTITKTSNGDGTNIDTKNFDAAGKISNETQLTTSPDGKTVTLWTDTNGDGKAESFVTTEYGQAATSVDTKNYSNDKLTSETTVVTSIDNKSVTTSIDKNGDGRPDEIDNIVYVDSKQSTPSSEVVATYNYGAGTVNIDQINYNPGGAQCTFDSKTETMSGGTTLSEVTGTQTNSGDVLTANVTGSGAVVSANNATVALASGASATVVGSDDSVSTGTGTNLSVSGSGNVVSAGANTTLNVSGGGNSVTATSGDTVTIGGTGTASDTVNASGASVTVSDGASAQISGSALTVTTGTGAQASIVDTQSPDIGYIESVVSDIGDYYAASGLNVHVGNGSSVSVTGNHENITAGNNDQLTVNGAFGTANIGSSTQLTNNGLNNTINGTGNDTIIVEKASPEYGWGSDTQINDSNSQLVIDSGASAYVVGNTDTVNMESGSGLSVRGTGDAINSSGNGIDVGWASSAVVNGTGNNIVLDSGNASVTASGDSITAEFKGDQLSGSNDNVVVTANGSLGISGNSDTVTLGSGAYLGINGTGEVVNSSGNGMDLGSNSSATINGTGNSIGFNGVNDTLTSSGNSIHDDIGGATGETLIGSNNSITETSGSSINVYGTYDPVTGTNASVSYNGDNTGDLVSGSGDTGGDWSPSSPAIEPPPASDPPPVNDPPPASDPPPSGGGYYGYDGFAGSQRTVNRALGSNISSIAQYDLAHGDTVGAAAAQIGFKEAQAAQQSAGVLTQAPAVLEAAKWDSNVVTWSLGDASAGAATLFSSNMSSAEEAAVQQAFATWADASGLKFVEVADSSRADIRVGLSDLDTANTGVVGYTTFHAAGGSMESGAVVRVEDPTESALLTGSDGQATYAGTQAEFEQVLLHEIGHALGLASNGDAQSVMSYELTGNNLTLDGTDVAGIQALYGSSPGSLSSSQVITASQLVQAMASFAPSAPGTQSALFSAANQPNQSPLLAVAH